MRNLVVAAVVVVLACGSKDKDKDGDKAAGGYSKRSKATEATLQLNKIGKLAKRAFAESSVFPRGTAAQLPAGGGCCAGKDGKCAPDSGAFRIDPTWNALGFSIDEPNRYQYTYTSDGKSFTATAVGDPECSGSQETWTLNGSVDSTGNPTINVVGPS